MVKAVDSESEQSAAPSHGGLTEPRFRSMSYVERAAEKFGLHDENEASRCVASALQAKHDAAERKREDQLRSRQTTATERMKHIAEARRALQASEERAKEQLRSKCEERVGAALRRKRRSLENIKAARELYNKRVALKRSESLDYSEQSSAEMNSHLAAKLARAEARRAALREARRRRAAERYEVAKARYMGLPPTESVCTSRERTEGRQRRQRRERRCREAAARSMWHARVIQAWWRCVCAGTPIVLPVRPSIQPDEEGYSADSSPDDDGQVTRPTVVSDAMAAAAAAGVLEELQVPSLSDDDMDDLSTSRELSLSMSMSLSLDSSTDDSALMQLQQQQQQRSSSNAATTASATASGTEGSSCGSSSSNSVSGIVTGQRAFPVHASLDAVAVLRRAPHEAWRTPASRRRVQAQGRARTADAAVQDNCYYYQPVEVDAALRIQSAVRSRQRRNRVARSVLKARESFAEVFGTFKSMETASFYDSMTSLRSPKRIWQTEAALQSLRMGREIRAVPANARTARSFLACALVHYFPASALDDGGMLTSPLTALDRAHSSAAEAAAAAAAAAELELERQRLIRAAAAAVSAVLSLEGVLSTVASAHSTELSSDVLTSVARAAATVSRARVAFCCRFDAWKKLDAERLAKEMTRACEDVLLMQMRAEKHLRAAAEAYGLSEADTVSAIAEDAEGGVTFATGFQQIQEGTAQQVSRMLAALSRLIGSDAAKARITAAAERAHDRLLLDDEDTVYPNVYPDVEDGVQPAHNPAFAPSGGAVSSSSVDAVAEGGAAQHSSASSDCSTDDDVDDDVEGGESQSDLDMSSKEAGTSRPLSAGDLLSNEWLVHEIMVSADEHIKVSLQEAVENRLLDDSAAGPSTPFPNGPEAFWTVAEAAFAAGDYAPLLGLIATLRDRIIGLTPRRKDLAAETAEAMDVELLAQMARHSALKPECFFQLAAFAGGRVLELEAPVRNEATSAKLREWDGARTAVETGASTFTLSMVRSALEYLLSKVDEIHLDILNAHLQFVTPFLRRNGVEYERDRFVEKLDAAEVTLEKTHNWLQSAVTRLRVTASTADASGAAAAALLRGLEAQRGDAYLELLRGAMVDQLLGVIVRADVKPRGAETARLSPAQVAARAEDSSDDHKPAAFPETLMMDQYRLIIIAAGVEQVAYTAALLAFSKQVLGALKLSMSSADETNMRQSLMTLFETQDITSADITTQVVEMCRAIAARSSKPLPASHSNLLTSRTRAILTTGDCPVYKLYLNRVLSAVKALLVSGGSMSADAFTALLSTKSLGAFQEYLVTRVASPLARVQRHSEAVYTPYYNEIIPLCMHLEAHTAAMNVD